MCTLNIRNMFPRGSPEGLFRKRMKMVATIVMRLLNDLQLT